MKKKSEPILVSLDVGNGYVKARGPNDAAASFPSVLSQVSDQMSGFDFSLNGAKGKFIIGYRGERYAIGDTVYFEGLTPLTIPHRSRISTDFYRVLFAAALSEVVHHSSALEVVVSLPPAAYWDRDQQKSVLSGTYALLKLEEGGMIARDYEVDIQNIRVIPEGVGTICVMALNAQGREQENGYLAHSVVGVVDIGTYTTDYIMLDSLRIVRAGCDSEAHALNDIHQRLRTYVSSFGVDMEAYRADDVLKRGYFLKEGRRVNLSDVRANWITEMGRVVAAKIRALWNGGNDVESIVITGGGAPWVEKMLSMEFPHIKLVEGIEPFFANCEGGYRYGLLRQRVGR